MVAIEPSEIVATLRESLLVLTEDLRVEFASESFFDTFEVSEKETLGQELSQLGNGQWNIPALLELLDRVITDQSTVEDYKVEQVFDTIGRRVMCLNARRTVRLGNGSRRILLAIEDVTTTVDAAREAERERRLAQGIVDTIREPLLVLDGDLKIIAASLSFYKKFDVDEAETVGHRLWDVGGGHWATPELIHLLTAVIPDHTVVDDFEISHEFPKLGRRTILLNARKIFREGNNSKTLLLAMEDITEKQQLASEREAALEQATRLLSELNHRVMNSLTMIGAIIGLESRSLTDDRALAAFDRMRRRIKSVASLYSNLSRAGSVDTVTASDYLPAIVDEVIASVGGPLLDIEVEADIEPVILATQTAVPLGLLVNEIATNSMKYAYKGRSFGRLGIRFWEENGRYHLTLWDDGSGIDKNARVDSGLGQRLTGAFTDQLGGRSTVDSDSSGTRFSMNMPILAHA